MGTVKLPSLKMTNEIIFETTDFWQRKLPERRGLYIVWHKNHALYVGISNNIKKRWQHHHFLLHCFLEPKEVFLETITSADSNLWPKGHYESDYIEKLKPFANWRRFKDLCYSDLKLKTLNYEKEMISYKRWKEVDELSKSWGSVNNPSYSNRVVFNDFQKWKIEERKQLNSKNLIEYIENWKLKYPNLGLSAFNW